MRAAVIAGGAVTCEERPAPVPQGGEVLVRVRAAGINGADLLQRAGHYPPPSGAPSDMPGLELAGLVESLGPAATRFRPGDRVMGIVAGAGQAELVAVHERVAMPAPAGLSWAEAGGFAEVFTTAHDALFTQCGLGPGDRLLVNGAAGGVGVAAVQLAVASGATVVASVRSPGRREALSSLGAHGAAPDEAFGLGPFDVVLELVGGPNLPRDMEALRTGGRVAVIGVGAGAIGELDLRVLMARRARISGSTLRARPLEEKALAARLVEHDVLPLLSARRVVVPVHATFPLEDVAAAYEAFSAGEKFGKIVLTIDS